MPFDDPSVRVRDVDAPCVGELHILDDMARRLATPAMWCKRRLCDRSWYDGSISYCLAGAFNITDHGDVTFLDRMSSKHEIPGTSWGTRSAAAANVWTRFMGFLPEDLNPVAFNDEPKTTHADILSLIARARASFE